MEKPRKFIGNRAFLKALAGIFCVFSREMMKDAFEFEVESQNLMDNLRRALVVSVPVKEIGCEIREMGCEQPSFCGSHGGISKIT